MGRRGNKKLAVAQPSANQTIRVVREGDWMPVDVFREAAARAASGNATAFVDLEGVDYLDASSLQILLALEAAQRKSSLSLCLANASPALRRWFEYAGAIQVFQFA